MDEPKALRYRLGSRKRWFASWLQLCIPFVAMYAILRVAVPDLAWILFLIVLPFLLRLVGLALGTDAGASKDWHVPVFSDVDAHLAYGSAEEDGIRFRKWLRRHFVTWKAIERVEFWPERGARLELHLFKSVVAGDFHAVRCRPRCGGFHLAQVGASLARALHLPYLFRKTTRKRAQCFIQSLIQVRCGEECRLHGSGLLFGVRL